MLEHGDRNVEPCGDDVQTVYGRHGAWGRLREGERFHHEADGRMRIADYVLYEQVLRCSEVEHV